MDLGIGLDGCGENFLHPPPPAGYEPRTAQPTQISCSSCQVFDSVVLEGAGSNFDLVPRYSSNECFIFSNF